MSYQAGSWRQHTKSLCLSPRENAGPGAQESCVLLSQLLSLPVPHFHPQHPARSGHWTAEEDLAGWWASDSWS